MRIGVDLRVLQIGHQYRGIGEVAKQCLNRMFVLSKERGDKVEFTFYLYELSNKEIDPKSFLDVPKDLQHEEVSLGRQPVLDNKRRKIDKLIGKYRRLFGDPIPQAALCDVFLQFDYALGIPSKSKTLLIAHDIIPYIFQDEYHRSSWSYLKQLSVFTAIRTFTPNFEYNRILKRSFKRATHIVCVSESTRKDLHRYLHVPLKKMSVTHLGVSDQPSHTGKGSKKAAAQMPTKPYLLFIGDVDKRRRRVDDLIKAYDRLKSEGHDIQLALAGNNFESFEKVKKILDPSVSQSIAKSPHRSDILLLGYIDDSTKQDLFRHALAFVFPSIYEGFGIPILEAMLLGAPVITYQNSSITEVARDFALYAKDSEGIYQQAAYLMVISEERRQYMIGRAFRHAQSFSWDETARQLYEHLLGVAGY